MGFRLKFSCRDGGDGFDCILVTDRMKPVEEDLISSVSISRWSNWRTAFVICNCNEREAHEGIDPRSREFGRPATLQPPLESNPPLTVDWPGPRTPPQGSGPGFDPQSTRTSLYPGRVCTVSSSECHLSASYLKSEAASYYVLFQFNLSLMIRRMPARTYPLVAISYF